VSLEAMRSAWDVPDLTPPQRLVALCLGDHADRNGRSCFPSLARIAERTGLSRRTIQRAVDALEAVGFVERRLRSAGGVPRYHLSAGGVSVTPPGVSVTPPPRQPDTRSSQLTNQLTNQQQSAPEGRVVRTCESGAVMDVSQVDFDSVMVAWMKAGGGTTPNMRTVAIICEALAAHPLVKVLAAIDSIAGSVRGRPDARWIADRIARIDQPKRRQRAPRFGKAAGYVGAHDADLEAECAAFGAKYGAT